MKYYSEELKKLFDDEKSLKEAESAAAKEAQEAKAKKEALIAARKDRAAEIEKLIKQRAELDKDIRVKLAKFTKDYGSFHYSYKDDNFPFFDSFFDWFF